MIFQKSTLVLLSLISVSFTTFPTSVDCHQLRGSNLRGNDPDASESTVASTIKGQEQNSQMGKDSDVSDPDASERTVASTIKGQEQNSQVGNNSH
jgi:hypothetical protein